MFVSRFPDSLNSANKIFIWLCFDFVSFSCLRALCGERKNSSFNKYILHIYTYKYTYIYISISLCARVREYSMASNEMRRWRQLSYPFYENRAKVKSLGLFIRQINSFSSNLANIVMLRLVFVTFFCAHPIYVSRFSSSSSIDNFPLFPSRIYSFFEYICEWTHVRIVPFGGKIRQIHGWWSK